MVQCAIFECASRSGDPGRRFFRFPRETFRCNAWIYQANRPDLANRMPLTLYQSCFLCDLHFNDYCLSLKNISGQAIPTLNLPQKRIRSISMHATENMVTMQRIVQSFMLDSFGPTSVTANVPIHCPLPELPTHQHSISITDEIPKIKATITDRSSDKAVVRPTVEKEEAMVEQQSMRPSSQNVETQTMQTFTNVKTTSTQTSNAYLIEKLVKTVTRGTQTFRVSLALPRKRIHTD